MTDGMQAMTDEQGGSDRLQRAAPPQYTGTDSLV
jgi:hypothetical protein